MATAVCVTWTLIVDSEASSGEECKILPSEEVLNNVRGDTKSPMKKWFIPRCDQLERVCLELATTTSPQQPKVVEIEGW